MWIPTGNILKDDNRNYKNNCMRSITLQERAVQISIQCTKLLQQNNVK